MPLPLVLPPIGGQNSGLFNGNRNSYVETDELAERGRRKLKQTL